MLPSFEPEWADNKCTKPRIQVLKIRHRDRPDGETVAWLLVERQETYRIDPDDGTVYEASIRINYQRISARYSHREEGKGRFDGGYFRGMNRVSVTSNSASHGAVFLDLPGLDGQRIGTYLMNEVVRWAQRWPEATVNSVQLLSLQGEGENKERRNWFYEQFGLVFVYADPERRAGLSNPMPAGELTQVETWKQNISEHRMTDYLADLLYSEKRASSELAFRNRACDDLIAGIRRAEAQPIRWALKVLYLRYVGLAVSGTIVALLCILAWAKISA